MDLLKSRMAVAVRNRATFEEANAFCSWAFENWSDEELSARSLPDLFWRFRAVNDLVAVAG